MANINLSNGLNTRLDLLHKFFKGFADKSRLAIFECLINSEKTVTEIVEWTGLSQSNVSNHLRQMRDSGLVEIRKEGKYIYYRVFDSRITYILMMAKDLVKGQTKEKNRVLSNNVKDRSEKINKIKVLVVCVHNSARSQMAEEFIRQLGGDRFIVESAGIEPGSLNPLAVEAMADIGYDISNRETDSVFEFFKEGRQYHYVIKVCDSIHGERCPIFPGVLRVLDWNIKDPSNLIGTYEEQLEQTKAIRDAIKEKVMEFIQKV